MLPRPTFSRTYDNVGSYDHACAVHSYMAGKSLCARLERMPARLGRH